jgi:hypothetical protein
MSDFKKALQSHFQKSVGYEKGQFDIKKQMAKNTFGGDDLLSSIIRGKLGVKDKKDEKKGKSPSKEGEQGIGSEATSVLVIIAKNTMVLPGMARDMKNLSQNIQKLVKLKGGKSTSSASDFFRKQKDKVSGKLKPGKAKSPAGGGLAKAAPKAGIMDILGNIASFIGGALIEVVKSLFNPRMIIRLLGRLALPLLIISTLVSGIIGGWKKWSETGSFKEALIGYFGGMLEFLTFGLLGEDAVRAHLNFLEGLFTGVVDVITKVFNSVKGFLKNIFGDLIEIDDKPLEKPDANAPPKDSAAGATSTASSVTPQQAPAQSAMNQASASFDKVDVNEANKTGADLTSKMTSMGVPEGTVPKGIFGDLAGVMNAGAGGDFGAMIAAGEDLKKKYPVQPKPAAPTPVEQAASNYELNKSLTQKASAATGVDLPMPAPPSAVMGPATAAAGGTATSLPKSSEKTSDLKEDTSSADYHAKSMGVERPPEQVSQVGKSAGSSLTQIDSKAESNRMGALQFMKRSLGIMPPDPKKPGSGYTDLRDNDKPLSEDEVRKRISAAGKDPEKIISLLNDTGKGGGTLDLSSGNLNTITGGAVGAGAGTSPMPVESSSSSGASISSASAEVAEGQRMESAADKGSVVNAGTTNNSSGSTGKPNKQTASAYDDSFALKLATK